MRLENSFGCPTRASVPTPTPTPWPPKCRYIDRYTIAPAFGVDIDLAYLNGGPYGIRVPVTWKGKEHVIFFQPCERMSCPVGFTCPTDTWSSVWFCEKDGARTCDSHGLVNAQNTYISLIDPLDETWGFKLDIFHGTERDKNTTLYLKCNSIWPEGHIKFTSEVIKDDMSIVLNGTTKEACPTALPTPAPPTPGGNCSWADISERGESVAISFSDLNNGTSGWLADVNIQMYPTMNKLMYQPCGGMYCPDDTFCDGDEDATVWLCSGDDCKAYGLLANNLTARVSTNPRGISVNYKGDRKRQANIIYTYDKNANSTHPVLPTDVTLENTLILNIVVGTSHFHEKAGVSGGAIFLIIFFVGIFAYVLGTVLFHYWRHREWAAPHKEFWLEVALSIKWGVVFVFTCNKVSLGHSTEVKYDAI